MRNLKLKHIGLQFFSEPTDPNTDPQPGDPNPGAGGDPKPQEKTFTQAEVTRMLANEKRQGRNSVLKDLGIDPEDKDGVKNAKGILDAQKTQAQLDREVLSNEKTARAQAEAKAVAAERRVGVMLAKCKGEFLDEVIALASAKVTDTVDFDAALKAVKEKCPTFFEDGDGGDPDPGTGKGQGHKKTSNTKPGEFGSRLAQGVVSATPAKNPYFNN